MSIYIMKSRGQYYAECSALYQGINQESSDTDSVSTTLKKENSNLEVIETAKGKIIVLGTGSRALVQQAFCVFKKILNKKTVFSGLLVVNSFFPKYEERLKAFGATAESIDVVIFVVAGGVVYYIAPSSHCCRAQEQGSVYTHVPVLANTIKDANGHEGFALLDDVFDILINRQQLSTYPLLRISTNDYLLEYKMDAHSSWERCK
jgi:hypothetical protein